MPVSWVKCCQVVVSATSRSPVQRSPVGCGVSEYDRGTSQRSHTECGVSEYDRETSQRSPTGCGVSEYDRGTSQSSHTECGVSDYDRGTSRRSHTECGVSEYDRVTSQGSPTECGVSEYDRGPSQRSPTECGVSMHYHGYLMLSRSTERTRRKRKIKPIIRFSTQIWISSFTSYPIKHCSYMFLAGPVMLSVYSGISKSKCKKVNQSHYRPEVPRGFQEVKVPRLRDTDSGWW